MIQGDNFFDDSVLDKEKCAEATGNAGATMDRFAVHCFLYVTFRTSHAPCCYAMLNILIITIIIVCHHAHHNPGHAPMTTITNAVLCFGAWPGGTIMQP